MSESVCFLFQEIVWDYLERKISIMLAQGLEQKIDSGYCIRWPGAKSKANQNFPNFSWSSSTVQFKPLLILPLSVSWHVSVCLSQVCLSKFIILRTASHALCWFTIGSLWQFTFLSVWAFKAKLSALQLGTCFQNNVCCQWWGWGFALLGKRAFKSQ